MARHYAAVGAILHMWSRMEGLLDYLIGTLFWIHGRRELKDVPRPLSLEQRLAFIKDEASKIPTFAPYSVEATALANRIASIKEQRHVIVHATPIKFFKRGGALYIRVKPLPDDLGVDFVVMKRSTMLRLDDAIAAITAELGELAVNFGPPADEVERQHPQSFEAAARLWADATRRIAANELGRRQARSQARPGDPPPPSEGG